MPKQYWVNLTKTQSTCYEVPVMASCAEDAIDLAKLQLQDDSDLADYSICGDVDVYATHVGCLRERVPFAAEESSND